MEVGAAQARDPVGGIVVAVGKDSVAFLRRTWVHAQLMMVNEGLLRRQTP